MLLLLLTSLVWAFSFGLIKHHLGLDPNLSAFIRLLISFLLFLPLLQPRTIPTRTLRALFLVGAIQHGLMYALYMNAFRFLPAHLVAVFTIFTPIFVTLIHDWDTQHWHLHHLGAATLAVLGAGIVVAQHGLPPSAILGFFILQIANFCFAFGQIKYRTIMRTFPDLRDHQVFAAVFCGATAAAAIPAILSAILILRSGNLSPLIPTSLDACVLAYLGIIPSGLCFFLWNVGARQAHPAVLAVMNNLKIPLAAADAILVFHEPANLPRLLAGGAVMLLAVLWSQQLATQPDPQPPDTQI